MKETVKLQIEIPKGVLDFINDFFKFSGYEQPLKEFLQEALVSDVRSILSDLPTKWFNEGEILKRYGLDEE